MDAPSLAERLRAAMNEARKQRDQARTLLLSTILSDVKNRELELNHPASDEETAEVLRRGIKRRREAVEVYEKAGRADRAQVAELAALLITDDSIRAEPVPDITPTLELLTVPGSALEATALAELTVALGAMRVTAADLKRLGTTHDARRTVLIRVDPPPRELETTLVRSIGPDGAVLDGASRDLARARQHVREARQHVMQRLSAILGKLDPTERAPDAAVPVRGGRY